MTNELKELIRIGDALTGGSNTSNVSYTNPNYSGTINAADTPQDLAAANPNRDRLTIQNLDDTETLLIGIDEDALIGRSVVIDPGAPVTLEEGEADKRISIRSAKAGLSFVAIGRIKQ